MSEAVLLLCFKKTEMLHGLIYSVMPEIGSHIIGIRFEQVAVSHTDRSTGFLKHRQIVKAVPNGVAAVLGNAVLIQNPLHAGSLGIAERCHFPKAVSAVDVG